MSTLYQQLRQRIEEDYRVKQTKIKTEHHHKLRALHLLIAEDAPLAFARKPAKKRSRHRYSRKRATHHDAHLSLAELGPPGTLVAPREFWRTLKRICGRPVTFEGAQAHLMQLKRVGAVTPAKTEPSRAGGERR